MKSFKFLLCSTILVLVAAILLSSCLNAKKMDKFISNEYNNQLPKPDKKRKVENISIASVMPSTANVSASELHSKVLPLLVYWKFDYRMTSDLNSQIALSNFTNTVGSLVNKGLSQKLNGKKLELTIEQAPSAFSLVDITHVIWLIYGIHWSKDFIQPVDKDLVVSYKLYNNGDTKTGKITIKSSQKTKNLRFFQSWKSATREYLSDYDTNVSALSKEFINKLMAEI